jgi:hypothetical protein
MVPEPCNKIAVNSLATGNMIIEKNGMPAFVHLWTRNKIYWASHTFECR